MSAAYHKVGSEVGTRKVGTRKEGTREVTLLGSTGAGQSIGNTAGTSCQAPVRLWGGLRVLAGTAPRRLPYVPVSGIAARGLTNMIGWC